VSQIVTLRYVDTDTHDKVFNVYGLHYEDSEFERNLHHSEITGKYREDNIGYRTKFDIDFMPLQNDKVSLFFLQDFFLSKDKRIVFSDPDEGIVDLDTLVSLRDENLNFDFMNQTYFANAFTLSFTTRSIYTVADDGSTRRIVLYYVPDDGANENYYCNLEDDSSLIFLKRNLSFVGGGRDDLSFAFSHKLSIDFGEVKGIAKREWLRDFCLWGKKEVDTRQIDPVNGKVYSVVCLSEGVKWEFQNGVKNALVTSLVFVEKDPRTESEIVNDAFIVDVDTTDSKVLGE